MTSLGDDRAPYVLSFQGGTVRLAGIDPEESLVLKLPRGLTWDPRENVFRAPAVAYANIVL